MPTKRINIDREKKYMANTRERKYGLFPVAQTARNLAAHDLRIPN